MASGVQRSDLLALYHAHPLREATILERILRRRGSLAGVSETDLATDPYGGATDQNHVGGMEFVEALARAARVTGDSRVVDLGAGLGGAARVLAARVGCQVRAIELIPERCQEAKRLTALVGLGALVEVVCGDAHDVSVPRGGCDVLWGQSAWIHFHDKRAALGRWLDALPSGGRVAFEDACTTGRPRTARVDRIEALWQSSLVREEEWTDLFSEHGLRVTVREHLREKAIDYFRTLSSAADRWAEPPPDDEVEAWRLAKELLECEALTYVRIVAERAR